MKLTTAAFALFALIACTKPGAQGDTGASGQNGAQGERGASGVCDVSSCPSLTSIDGLEGGAIGGTTSVQTLSASSTVTLSAPRGVVVSRGGQSTSVGGFFCGRTVSTVGSGAGAASGTIGNDFGVWVVKRACEQACNDAAAHVCSSAELMMSQALGGGRQVNADPSRFPNAAVHMPETNEDGWVQSADGVGSCDNFQATTSGVTGLSFHMGQNGGGFAYRPCDQAAPFFCCL